MTAKRMSAVDDDAPALAGAIVYHAGEVCESVDHSFGVWIPTNHQSGNIFSVIT
jgi:hypothetical protein